MMTNNAPSVDVHKSFISTFFPKGDLKIPSHPIHKMVFECAFDHLMQKIGR